MPLPFESRNKDDFEANTKLIDKAIREIERNPELKPTITQLQKLTGLHRNTLSNREGPKAELRRIVELRNQATQSQAVETPKDKVAELNAIIENAKSELVFWYNKVRELEKSVDQLSSNLTHMSNSKNFYMEELAKMRKSRDELASKVDRLTDLLHLKNGALE